MCPRWVFILLLSRTAVSASPARADPDCGDLDPGQCSVRCQSKGYSVATASRGHQGRPSRPRTHAPGQCVVLLSLEEGEENMGLRINLFVSGTAFSFPVFLKRGALQDQPSGILGLGLQELSNNAVEFLGLTPKGQSSLHDNNPHHSVFKVSSDWRLEAPGAREIRVSLSSFLSMFAANCNISQRSPDSLLFAHGPRGEHKAEECTWCLCLRPGQEIQINKTVNKSASGVQDKEFILDMDAVEVHAPKRAYPLNEEVPFSARSEARGSVEFLWHFGDSTSAQTSLRTITKRYRKPGRYNATVVMATARTSVTSEPFLVIIQRAVRVNRLVHQASVLQNHTATLGCRVNAGTEVGFLWSFGDGSVKLGQSVERHVFRRVGEFLLEVTVFNLVSSARLRSHIFVVDRPCQPPAVKNMGPLTVKVPRYKAICVGVTFEPVFDCDILISGGIEYTWTLYDSMGRNIFLPHTETQRQTLTLPKHFLHYDTYTAVAKVQVVGSVVYSNYSIKMEVINTAPVAVISGGTNVFISNKNTTVVRLDGTKSHDPDFPHNSVRLSWSCKPISSIPSSCFDHDVSMTSAVLTFTASSLKQIFDQFQVTLTVSSAGRSASSDVFLTVTADLQRKVSVDCPQCQNDVDWDKRFTVRAFCENCPIPADLIRFTWSLFQVNASSKPVLEAPFCDTVDLSDPSALKGTPTALPPAPEASPRLPAVARNPLNGSKKLKRHRRGDDLFHVAQRDLDLDSSVSSNGDLLESSSDWDFPFILSEKEDGPAGLDLHHDDFFKPEEGESEVSPGRISVEDGESFGLTDEFETGPHGEEGSNLLDPRPPVLKQWQTLLDLPRDPVAPWIFESYTDTGLSSSQLSFKPFSLRPGSRFMLEVKVTHDSQKRLLGRTQLFFQTKPSPRGMTCHVQPSSGVELLTVFSIFCSSGKEDLLHKFSYRVGEKHSRTLYQGTDFEHYFSLPAGEPNEANRVTISIEVRSSLDGGTTQPCPVTVTVQPQFARDTSSSRDPALELSQIALRNLSSLVRLGNSIEILNYVSIVADILNRLSLEPEANIQALAHLRNALVCIVCGVETIDQISTQDAIRILLELLKIPKQVSLSSVRKLTDYTQAVSERLPPDGKTLNLSMALLSNNLKVVLSSSEQKHVATETDPSIYNLLGKNSIPDLTFCLKHSTDALKGSSLAPPLVDRILQTISLLALKFSLVHKSEGFALSGGLVSVFAGRWDRSATVSGASSVFYLPLSAVRRWDPCVVSVVTELNQNPFTFAEYGASVTGPVVELSLFKCSTRRKIPVRFYSEPFSVKLQPTNNRTFSTEFILHHDKISYHSFNVTQGHLQHGIHLHVQFLPSATRGFPVLLLFRMFEKPTPSEHHLRKFHNWQRNDKRIIQLRLPSSFLNAAGVMHLALLNADFEQPHRQRTTQLSYRLRVARTQCLSWDGPGAAWTGRGCKTQVADTSSTINCSCHLLRPVTVMEQQISTSYDRGEIHTFVSGSHNWAVVAALVLVLCLYGGALLLGRRDDFVSEEKQVHFLSDNSPCEPCLYVVTVHTGLCSAAQMSAKVYIVLFGENGFSQTKELQASGFCVFRRNSQNTFILSPVEESHFFDYDQFLDDWVSLLKSHYAAESLGSVCGIHIWHNNSGLSPSWYLKRVEVYELSGNHAVQGHTWLFLSECWLAVDRDDGRVERVLPVCNGKIGFTKVVRLKVWDYMSDFHVWISAYSCPSPSSFTRCQRLSVCLLLLLGYGCASAILLSLNTDKYLELNIRDISVNSVTTGLFSVVLVLPSATIVSLLFRLRKLKMLRPENESCGGTNTDGCFEDARSLSHSLSETRFFGSVLPQWLEESWRKKNGNPSLSPVSGRHLGDRGANRIQNKAAPSQDDVIALDDVGEIQDLCSLTEKKNENKPQDKAERGQVLKRVLSWWLISAGWVLWLLLCVSCLAVAAALGLRFSNKQAALWMQSLFFSLLFCIFFIHPLLIFLMALGVSLWHNFRKTLVNHIFSAHHIHHSFYDAIQKGFLHRWENPSFLQLLEARQRIRFLRLVQPPTLTELRKSRSKRKGEALIFSTVRDRCLFVSLLVIVLCVTYASCSRDLHDVNKSVRKRLISEHNGFLSVRTYEDWWSWTQNTFLNVLYINTTNKLADLQESPVLIGEPVVWKSEVSRPKNLLVPNSRSENSDLPKMATSETKCNLGNTRSLAASKLSKLHSQPWIGRSTVGLHIHFALHCPAPNVFTSVALTVRQRPFGLLQPSAQVRSVTVFRLVSDWDYAVVAGKIIFLLLLFLRLCHKALVIGEKGLIRFCKVPSNWLEVAVAVVASCYYICTVYRSVLVSEVAEMLKRQDKTQIDFTPLASWDQSIRSLSGILVLLLIWRCLSLVINFSLSARLVCCILWILIAGLIGVSALFCIRYYFHFQCSKVKHQSKCSKRFVLHHDMAFVIARLVWTALVINVLSFSGRGLWRRRGMFTATDFLQCIKNKLFSSWTRSAHTDDHMERKTYYFEQFERVLDELLLRLDSISDKTVPEVCSYKLDSPTSAKKSISCRDIVDFPESKMKHSLATSVHSKIAGPDELEHLQSRDQMRSKRIILCNEQCENETGCDENTGELTVVDSKGQRSLKSPQPVSTERVVKVLIHEEHDRSC